MFKRVLVANRGEIAIRIIKALKELGITSVAMYSDTDKDSTHCMYADIVYSLNGTTLQDTYINIQKIFDIAKNARVDAVHPGYGFLSQNENFVRLLEQNDITFIGPDSNSIKILSDKVLTKKLLSSKGIPILYEGLNAVKNIFEAFELVEEIGFPVIVKSLHGNAGCGIGIASNSTELLKVFEKSINHEFFTRGDSGVIIEKYFENAKHIEVQILGDRYGNIIHLGERDCSIQRRFQKIIAESPSAGISEKVRQEVLDLSIQIAKEIHYQSIGTVEFIHADGKTYFLHINTTIPVDHPVTELLTGIDIVKNQIKIAASEKLSIKQDDIIFKGHALECRIFAEDPFNNFSPSPNKIVRYNLPGGKDVRIDSGVHFDYEVSPYFEPMLSKLTVLGENRTEAISKMRRALDEYIISGPSTNIPYLKALIDSEIFLNGSYKTNFVREQIRIMDIAKAVFLFDQNKNESPDVFEAVG